MYAENLAPRDRATLALWGLKPAHRKGALAAAGVGAEDLARLEAAGYLKTLPGTGGLYLADGGTLVLGPKMRDRLAQLAALEGGAPYVAPHPAAPIPRAERPPKVRKPDAPRKKSLMGRVRDAFPLDAADIASLEATRAAHVPWISTTGIVPVEVQRPAAPGPGADCEAWRRKIVRGEPLFKPAGRGSNRTSYAARLRPIATGHRREPEAPAAYGGKVAAHWAAFHNPKAPVRVRCPSCERPIRLGRWWEHGCEKAIAQVGEALGNFHELTEGASPPVYDDEVAEAA